MDTSQEYIKMCGKAVEVQESWMPEAWDWCICEENAVVLSGYETDSGVYGHAIYDETSISGKKIEARILCDGDPNVDINRIHIWLPCQDQLIALLPKNDSAIPQTRPDWFYQINDIYNFSNFLIGLEEEQDKRSKRNKISSSLEQVLLKMVMKINYNLYWDGKVWCKKELLW